MINIDRMAVHECNKNVIPIRNAARRYEPDIYVEDGKKLSIIHSDGFRSTQRCKYIDDYHFMFGNNCYHVDQFAELVQKNQLRCEPEEYITDLNLYRRVYLDRELKDLDGKLIPYRAILTEVKDNSNDKVVAVCPGTHIDRMVGVYERDGNERIASFCSVEQAMTDIVPKLDLPEHQKNLLHQILLGIGKEIPRITEQEYEQIPKDYKGTYGNYNGRHPEWEGRRTAFLPGHGTTLFIEGVSFIIDKGRKPSLNEQVKAAAGKCETSHKEAQVRNNLTHDR